MDKKINYKREELESLICEKQSEYINEGGGKIDSNVKLVQLVLDIAIDMGVSDIHFEPCDESLKVRFRKDGNLFEFISIDMKFYKSILNIIKIESKLNIADSRNPQEGRITKLYMDRSINLRVSITPIYSGEKIVIRILDNDNFKFDISSIGLSCEEEEYFRKIINKKSGLIIITGPTGSGKTTTIYSLIKELNNNSKNIYTLEDPIENVISGVNQIQINDSKKIDIFKYILRQDPDIIVVGEIRDKVTALLALEASLSGHLVLSTMHGFNIVDILLRLKEMGIPDYFLTSAITCISSQKLIKTLCPECKSRDLEKHKFIAIGCEKCTNGYSGRIAVHEIALIDDLYNSNINSLNYTGRYNFLVDSHKVLNKYLREGIIDEKEYESIY